jgi:Tol biopolymer transport system component
MAMISNKQCRYFVTALCVLILAHQYGKSQGVLLKDSQYLAQEKHFANIKMLTFEGENAEAYFSFDDKMLSFQRRVESDGCDQIFIMDIDGKGMKQISNGQGRTTCSFFMPNGDVLFATTAYNDIDCPPPPDMSKGYVWPLLPSYDIMYADTATGKQVRTITLIPDYDAEATVSPDGKKIIFTSMRDGDIELYSCDIDGLNVKRLTFEPGYDGGAFYSADSKKIVFRASRPKDDQLKAYKNLLDENLVKPSKLDIFIMDADGTNKQQVTNNGAANFAPFFHPDGKRIIFCSNMQDSKGRNFDIYMINIDGTGLERITFSEDFDGFPMFSRDGKKIVFCSNRYNRKPGDTNIFIADWID